MRVLQWIQAILAAGKEPFAEWKQACIYVVYRAACLATAQGGQLLLSQ
jgi:hypothetical protein